MAPAGLTGQSPDGSVPPSARPVGNLQHGGWSCRGGRAGSKSSERTVVEGLQAGERFSGGQRRCGAVGNSADPQTSASD